MQARDAMTPDVATIRRDADLAEAIRLMVDRRISGLPVVDEFGRLVGMLTEGDLLRRSEVGTDSKQFSLLQRLLRGPGQQASDYVRANSRLVADLMTTDPVSASPGTPLASIVDLMEQRHIKRVPIVRDDEVVGIVSRSDILAAVDRRWRHEALQPSDDKAMLARLYAELEGQKWFSHHGLTFAVHDGTVHITGVVDSGRVRDALVVAAQNASGRMNVVTELMVIDAMSAMAMPTM